MRWSDREIAEGREVTERNLGSSLFVYRAHRAVRPLFRSDAIYVILEFPFGFFDDETVYVGLETGKLRIELPRELQIAHDRRVEALSRNQQWNTRRIGRQQHTRN